MSPLCYAMWMLGDLDLVWINNLAKLLYIINIYHINAFVYVIYVIKNKIKSNCFHMNYMLFSQAILENL